MEKDQVTEKKHVDFVGLLLGLSWSAYLCLPILGSDPWGAIARGNWHLAHGWVLNRDIWSGVPSNVATPNISWLYDTILACAFNSFGNLGLLGIKLGAVAVLVFSLAALFQRMTGEHFLSRLIAALISGGCCVRVELTPELLGMALFSLCLLFLQRIRTEGWFSLALVVGVLMLHQNISETAVISVASVIAFAMFGVNRRIRYLVIVLALISLLATPFFGAQILVAFQRCLADIAVALSSQQVSPALVQLKYAHVSLVLLLALRVLLQPHLKILEVLGLVLITVVSLSSVLLMPYGIIFLALDLAMSWSTGGGSANLRRALERLRATLCHLPRFGVIWLLSCFLLVELLKLYRSPVIDLALPVNAVDYLLENPGLLPTISPPGVAPYLAFRFSGPHGDPNFPVLHPTVGVRPGGAFALGIEVEELTLGTRTEGRSVLCRMGDLACDKIAQSNCWQKATPLML